MHNNQNKQSKTFLKYGSIISFMLDKVQINASPIIHESDEDSSKAIINLDQLEPKKEEDLFMSSEFLYSQGVFNEYSFFYQFKDINSLNF